MYLKLAGHRLGLLVKLNMPPIKDDILRVPPLILCVFVPLWLRIWQLCRAGCFCFCVFPLPAEGRAGPCQGRDREDQGVELLEVPEPGEVQADGGCWGAVAAFGAVDQPGRAACDG